MCRNGSGWGTLRLLKATAGLQAKASPLGPRPEVPVTGLRAGSEHSVGRDPGPSVPTQSVIQWPWGLALSLFPSYQGEMNAERFHRPAAHWEQRQDSNPGHLAPISAHKWETKATTLTARPRSPWEKTRPLGIQEPL